MFSFFRRIKPLYSLYNFFHKRELVQNKELFEKYGVDKKYYSPLSSSDFSSLEERKNTYDSVDSATELNNNAEFNKLSKERQKELLPWSEKGYVILKKFYDDETIDKVNTQIDDMLKKGEVSWKYGNKIMFAYRKSLLLKSIGDNDRLNKILGLLMDKPVSIFQSINFITGSQQRSHSDSIHMTTYPLGNLIACWVALEDIKLDSGPLHYYPGSHKLPYIMNSDIDNDGNAIFLGKKSYSDYEDKIDEVIKSKKLEKELFLAKKGDVLVWHANLIHGGEPRTNPDRTRKSMVFHYYSQDAICYHEITQRPSLMK